MSDQEVFRHPSDSALQQAALRVYERCESLAAISCLTNGVGRYYLTPEHATCNQRVLAWMSEAGMQTWIDAAGNCWGRWACDNPDAQTVILGSHLDTVAMAGKYDGILGVLSAIEVVELLKTEDVTLPFHIDVVGFGDEEGVRFGTTLLGSAAVAGRWQNDWFNLTDENGVTLAEAFRQFGLNPEEIGSANRAKDDIKAYLELHIEQGPVLEQMGLPVGIVTAIAGARRFRFTLKGLAGHAGTVPMSMRRDPLTAAAKILTEIENLAIANSVVATVGKLEVRPAAVNVIPGECVFTLDIRSSEDTVRDKTVSAIFAVAEAFCESSGIDLDTEEFHHADAVECAAWLQTKIEQSLREVELPVHSLMSGAGHDAMIFGDVFDIAMLFVRCEKGISHNPAEAVDVADVRAGLQVFARLLGNI
ncbi:allantoate amidohydrolase [Teredinibacter turnerae]|uniref:allantoate amidohydrolase n=1 Tax=Teredinibacter turnerae TaxID=2426 RepID=UPI00040F0989|nr:allantoate amidohydrolase [Teredinibacter turnerae]